LDKPTTPSAHQPINPVTTRPGGANALPVPNSTVTNQNAQQFDPRVSPGTKDKQIKMTR
jgi:hypothetical protein